MDFYVRNNLLKSEFKSFLLEWSGSRNWKIRGLGYPFLNYDYASNQLLIKFFDSKTNRELVKLNIQHFTCQMVANKNSVLLCYKVKLLEICIVFKEKETCARFYSILQDHVSIRKFIRNQDKRSQYAAKVVVR